MKKINIKKIISISFLVLISCTTVAILVFNRSKANEVLEIDAKIKDVNEKVEEESVKINSTDLGESGVAIVLPEIINGKKVNCYIVDKSKMAIDEEENEEQDENESLNSNNPKEESSEESIDTEENTNNNEMYNETNNSETNNDISEQKIKEKSTEDETEEKDSDKEESIYKDKNEQKYDKLSFELAEGKAIIYPEEYLYLTKDEIKNLQISLEVNYDAIKIDENTLLYNKQIETENESNKISATGYMPVNAEIKATEVKEEDIEEKTRNEVDEKSTLQCAYDIKILVGEEEFEPETVGKDLEITITGIEDTINKKYTILHIDNENKVESVDMIDKEQNKITFDATSFSIYTVYSTEDLTVTSDAMLTSASDDTTEDDTYPMIELPSTAEDVWDGSSVEEGFAFLGSGTSSDPYLITSCAELKYLADQVNDGTTYSGTYFELTRDLNLNGKSWTPIGNYSNSFQGIFNGSGRIIKNAVISCSDSTGGISTSRQQGRTARTTTTNY